MIRRFCEEETPVFSGLYGAYATSLDRYPDERRWAKRMALYELRKLLRSLSLEGRPVVLGMDIIEKSQPDTCEHGVNADCRLHDAYTWAWKCRIVVVKSWTL